MNSHQGHIETNKMGKVITIGTKEFNFISESITIKKGERVTVILENRDEIEPDLGLETDKVKLLSTSHHNHNRENLVHIHANINSKSKMIFTVLQEGTFNFKCTIPGHNEAGRHGKIKVI